MNKYGTEEYWIAEELSSGVIDEKFYKDYIVHLNDELKEDFRTLTGYENRLADLEYASNVKANEVNEELDKQDVEFISDFKEVADAFDALDLDPIEEDCSEEVCPVCGKHPCECLHEEAGEKSVEEAKEEEELPADPEAVKTEVHDVINNLVADEIEAIDAYEEAKAEIADTHIEHKDEIVATIDHIEDEEKEHVDELVDAATEIPFGEEHKEAEEIKVETEPEVVEEPVEESVETSTEETINEAVDIHIEGNDVIIKDDSGEDVAVIPVESEAEEVPAEDSEEPSEEATEEVVEEEPVEESLEIDEKAINEAINAKLKETGNEDTVFETLGGSFDDSSMLIEGNIISGDLKVPTKFRFENLEENQYKVTNTLSDEEYIIKL